MKAWSAHRAMRNALACSLLLFPAVAFGGAVLNGDLYISKTDGATTLSDTDTVIAGFARLKH